MEKFDADEPEFNSTDLIGNDSFIEAIRYTESKDAKYWNAIYQKYPQKRVVINEARNLILNMTFKKDEIPVQYGNKIWDEIYRKTVLAKRKTFYKAWYGAAASLLIIGFLALHIFDTLGLSQIKIVTAPGEIKAVVLPDGSTVILNGNSELSYSKNWKKDNARKVFFQGDGNFRITKVNSLPNYSEGRKFLVLSGQSIVEVLGTEFTLHSRDEGTKVSLHSGRVSFAVSSKGKVNNESSLDRIILYPGEEAEYSKVKNRIEKRREDHNQILRWENEGVQFKGITLEQTLRYIKDIYGYDHIIENPSLLNRKITGKFSNTNLGAFIKTIESTLGIAIDINEQKKVLTISDQ